MQFRLWQLLVLSAAVPVACWMLFYATPWRASVLFTLNFVAILMAVVASVIERGTRRSAWIGFAIFAVGYYVVLHSPVLSMEGKDKDSVWRIQRDGPPLITSAILNWIYVQVLPQIHEQPILGSGGRVINGSQYPTEIEFARVGHSLFDLVLACLGGAFGYCMHRRFNPSP
jgi:nitrate reductase NapE component